LFFDNLSLDFKENEIAVLMAVNGRVKTTLMSYVADAWCGDGGTFFQGEFEKIE
jgi:ABC-type multidrug transport system ATPase subunit